MSWKQLPCGSPCLGGTNLGRDSCAKTGLRRQVEPPENPSTSQALLEFTEGCVVPCRKCPCSFLSNFHTEPCEALSQCIEGTRESPGTKACQLQTGSCGLSLWPPVRSSIWGSGQVLFHVPTYWVTRLVSTNPCSWISMPAGPYVFSLHTPSSSKGDDSTCTESGHIQHCGMSSCALRTCHEMKARRSPRNSPYLQVKECLVRIQDYLSRQHHPSELEVRQEVLPGPLERE